MQEIYRVNIYNNQGQCHFVAGPAELIESAYKEISEELLSPDVTGRNAIEIEGWSDSVDRAIYKLTIRTDSIIAVGFVQCC